MTPEDICKHDLRALTADQRDFYFANGFVSIDSIVGDPWLARLQELAGDFLDQSRPASGFLAIRL